VGRGLRTRTSRVPPRQAHWARRRFRTTSTERTRAPSVGSTRISRSGQAWPCLLFTHTGLAPHPVACREPGPPRQRMAGRFKLSRLRLVLRHNGREKDASHRLLQPTAIRAPSGLPDSRVRSPPRRSILADLPTRRRALTHLRPMASGEPPGEASLDGEPPASALPQPVTPCPLGLPRSRRRELVVPRGPGGASIERSSALHLPTAAFSTASRACDVASDALCRSPVRADPALRPNHPGEAARHRLRRHLVKDDCFAVTRTPSLDECSLPCKSGSRRSGRIIDSPPPCSRLCRREPASSTLSRYRARGR